MYKNGDICPICGSGKLTEKAVTETFHYKGKKLAIPDYVIYDCDQCREAFVARDTLSNTEKVIRDFHRQTDGLLTSEEIKAIRKSLKVNQTKFAEQLQVSRVSLARYESGKQTQSKHVDDLLRGFEKMATAQLTFEYESKSVNYKPSEIGYKQTYYSNKKATGKTPYKKGDEYAIAA